MTWADEERWGAFNNEGPLPSIYHIASVRADYPLDPNKRTGVNQYPAAGFTQMAMLYGGLEVPSSKYTVRAQFIPNNFDPDETPYVRKGLKMTAFVVSEYHIESQTAMCASPSVVGTIGTPRWLENCRKLPSCKVSRRNISFSEEGGASISHTLAGIQQAMSGSREPDPARPPNGFAYEPCTYTTVWGVLSNLPQQTDILFPNVENMLKRVLKMNTIWSRRILAATAPPFTREEELDIGEQPKTPPPGDMAAPTAALTGFPATHRFQANPGTWRPRVVWTGVPVPFDPTNPDHDKIAHQDLDGDEVDDP